MFAGFDTSGPAAVHGDASIDAEGRILPIRNVVQRGELGKIGFTFLGTNERIKDFIKQNPKWTFPAIEYPTEVAERMVRLEIVGSEISGKRDVGEPIAVVRLDARGFSLERKGVCAGKLTP